ncbi:fungal-specific transcription factor domain-containing protein [Xylariaceae sp. FL0255]|nr:fungal-specific transcription factor domain-containing protein [Xylariaceae sp. FL0255]
METPHHVANPHRSTSGCWTCRLRRKKCDERQPSCRTCDALSITCHYGDKPDWMDGGSKQEAKVEQLKRKVKGRGYRRRVPRAPVPEPVPQVSTPSNHSSSPLSGLDALAQFDQDRQDCTRAKKTVCGSTASGRSDVVLLNFFLEHVFPFIFPFYQPPALQGGRAWILELMLHAPVMRQATLCQSSYYFSLMQGTTSNYAAWEAVLSQTKNAFEILRGALKVIENSSVSEHLHGAARVMSGIMQVQRFEIQVLSFENCRAHLDAALALFNQVLDSVDPVEPACRRSRFDAVIHALGPASWQPAPSVQIPSAEQAAFQFSSALLLFDDIIASTALQEEPRLYRYHESLLCGLEGVEPAKVDLEGTVGCQNWVLLQLGEIAVLDAWKQRCNKAGNLDVIELVSRAVSIKASLELGLSRLDRDSTSSYPVAGDLADIFMVNERQNPRRCDGLTSSTTRIWAHAALLYLSLVVSGWQPASVEVRHHVIQVIDLLRSISPSALLRTVVWPFCVAGCLAEPIQEAAFRQMAEALRPSSVFGTARKALEIMEDMWRRRNVENAAHYDLSSYFRSQGDLVLLV